MSKRVLILGSSGFIGSNLTERLINQGHYVHGIDIELPNYAIPDVFHKRDLRYEGEDVFDLHNWDEVYVLACLMGGMGFIGDEEKHGYDIGVGSTQIITNSIRWIITHCPKAKVFYSSSACVYNQDLQDGTRSSSLRETDAIPANPDLLYGWQKLFSEFLFMSSGLDARIARFHNIFGEYGCYNTGKEKAPAALCRKVAEAKNGSFIEVWGTGQQTRSFLYIDECLDGVERLMNSNLRVPVNIGSDEEISINNLAKMIIMVSGKWLVIRNIDGNVGVNSRNSDNTMIEATLGWKPTQPLRNGIEKLYKWIDEQIKVKQEFKEDLKAL